MSALQVVGGDPGTVSRVSWCRDRERGGGDERQGKAANVVVSVGVRAPGSLVPRRRRRLGLCGAIEENGASEVEEEMENGAREVEIDGEVD